MISTPISRDRSIEVQKVKMEKSFSQTASFIWAVADLLRGDFKQSQYGRIILPFTLLRRLECVLAPSKDAVLAQVEKVKGMPEEAQEKLLLRASNLAFFNTSAMDLNKLGETGTQENLEAYVSCFSKDAREIFENFHFSEFVSQLSDNNLLYRIVQKFASFDLSLEAVSNHEMGLIFEELIRRFAESSNETAGEHFTPRDIVRLTTSLVFLEDDDALTKSGVVRSIYDPTAGTGGFLSSGTEYVHELNPNARIAPFGQELNPESYAICKADMLIKGQNVENIKYGNTLSNDQLSIEKFDYMLSNPPFGVDWKKIEKDVKDEAVQKGYAGRFGAGLPRVSDGSLLFLLHLISKMRPKDEGGSRIGIILNGSPLFTGGAGSGESEIRRHILESDLLEAIVALPTDMFYNTGIATYVWVLTNNKAPEKKGLVQLINAVDFSEGMQKSLGSKRKRLGEQHIEDITKVFGGYVEGEVSKIFKTTDFGFRRVTIERPLRLSAQFSEEKLKPLIYATGDLEPVMQWTHEEFGEKVYENVGEFEEQITAYLKAEKIELKAKSKKEIFKQELWEKQKNLHSVATKLMEEIGPDQFDDYNEFEPLFDGKLKALGVKLDAPSKKRILGAITWKNQEAQAVVKKVHKAGKGLERDHSCFEVDGRVVSYQPDGDLRDFENIPLGQDIYEYFAKEVLPHVPDAWIDSAKRDEKDEEIGIVGYEIPFNRHFYKYAPPRPLEEIDADLDKVTGEILRLLQEVHS